MAFEFTEIGPLVSRDPEAAATKLAELLAAKGGSLTALQAELGVDYRTLTRWLAKLAGGGRDVRQMARDRVGPTAPEAEDPRPSPEPRATKGKRRPSAPPP